MLQGSAVKKYASIKIWQSEFKALFLDYDNKNIASLSRLPKYKDKEKWTQKLWQTKLSV